MDERVSVIDQLERFVQFNFTEISGLEMQPGMRYDAMVTGWDGNSEARAVSDEDGQNIESDPPTALTRLERIEKCFKEALDKQFDKELERGQSLVGPHRDEIVFYLDEVELAPIWLTRSTSFVCTCLKIRATGLLF